MKFLFLLLFPIVSVAQCPPGSSYMPSISSEGVAILADSCYSDADVAGMWRVYFKSLCGEPVQHTVYTNYRYNTGNRWVNDSIGCQYREVYEKKVNGLWVEISKCLWYWENKARIKCYGGVNKNIEVPCCQHFHKTKPR